MFNLARSPRPQRGPRTARGRGALPRGQAHPPAAARPGVNALAAAFLEAGVGKGDIVALLMGKPPRVP